MSTVNLGKVIFASQLFKPSYQVLHHILMDHARQALAWQVCDKNTALSWQNNPLIE